MADTIQPKTTLEQLLAVQIAITNVESGTQNYTMDGVTIQYPALNILYAERQRLTLQYANENGFKPRVSTAKFNGAAW